MTFTPVTDLVVDWSELFLQLKREGWSTHEIAHFTGISKSTFMGWKNDDVQPRHPDGERMIAFWSQALAKHRGELPMKPMPLSAAKVLGR